VDRSGGMFVGREPELARLGALVESVSGGRGRVVVLEGEPGIGKSRLAEVLLSDCARRGFEVLSGRMGEVEHQRPFGVVVDALGVRERSDRARAGICRLLDGDFGSDGGGFGLEARIAQRLLGLVEEACAAGPVVVAVDDLQWADESALIVVKGIARLASAAPILLVCVSRSYPVGRALRALFSSLDYLGSHRFELAGLEAAAVEELAGALVGGGIGVRAREALAEAGGNPLFVGELVRCLIREEGAAVSAEGVLEMTGARVPPSLRLVILDELRSLPDSTLEVLRAGAIVGRSFTVGEVALISPSSVSDVVGALSPAQAAGFLTVEGERLCFRHDLIREAIYDDLAPAVRTGLHRFLAVRLAETGANAERVAAQVMLGAGPGDLEAIDWLRRAAAEVSASSPAIMVELLSRALELSVGAASGVRTGVLEELVRPLLWTGQAARAEQVCTEGLGLEPEGDVEALFWLGLVNSRILQGHLQRARETCEQAAGCVALTESDRLHLVSSRALSGMYLGDPAALGLARDLVATAPRSVPKGIAQELIAQSELFTGRADRALAAYQEVDAMREPVEMESRIWQRSGIRVRMWEGLALLDLDRLDEAADLLERELAARLAVPALPQALLAACRYHAGRFSDAVRECDAAVAAAELAGSLVPALAPAIAATIALHQGRLERAQELVAAAERYRTPAEFGGETLVRWTRTLLLEAGDRTADAADAAAGALESYMRAGLASFLAWHAPDLVRVALAAGDRDQAERAVQAAEMAAGQLPVASRRAGALRARGLLSDDPALLTEAVSAAREAGRPIDLAMALRDAAAALARREEKAPARSLAGEALELFSGLGAGGEERSARRLLRAAGLTLGARAKHAGARRGWDSLTSSELRIVELVAEGRSNPEIAQALYLSRRTVGWHLSNVFAKLAVSSRGELAAEVVRRELA